MLNNATFPILPAALIALVLVAMLAVDFIADAGVVAAPVRVIREAGTGSRSRAMLDTIR